MSARLLSLLGKIRNLVRQGAVYLSEAQKKHPRLFLLWCFLLPAGMMFLVHACYTVYPFGGNSVLVLDLNAQYVYFFEALRRAVYGDGSLLYSFSRNLGGEFVGIYAYYLASPLSYIVCLFPKANILEALYTIFVLKTGLSGLFCAIFIRRTCRVSKTACILASTAYALSGYAMVMQHNTMWIDCLFLLPLICLGVHSLIREKKFKLFTFTLALSILSNYYIGYMTCLFLVLYFFYAYFSLSPEERNPRGERFHFPRALMRMGLFSVIACLIACLIILPAYYSLTFGKNAFSDPKFTFTSTFDLFDLFGTLLFNSYDSVRYEGHPILYSGVLTVFLIPVYFLSRRFRIRERLASALIILAMLFSFSIRYLDLIWHGFQAPNWLNFRYSFMLIFLLTVLSAKAFDRIFTIGRKTVMAIGVTCLLLLVLTQHLDYSYVDEFAGFYPNLVLILLYTALLTAIAAPKLLRRRLLVRVTAVCVCVELFVGALLNLVGLDMDVVVSNRESYHRHNRKWQEIIEQVEEQDPSFYRSELLSHEFKINDPYSLGFYGITGSTSTLNASVISFLSKIGYSARSHWGLYAGSHPVADSLIGIRYLYTNSGSEALVPDLYEKMLDNGTVSVYRNPYALPLAFPVSDKINTITFQAPKRDEDGNVIEDERDYYDNGAPLARLNIMLREMLASEESLGICTTVRTTVTRENLNAYPVTGHTLYTAKDTTKEASITYTFTGDGKNEIYAYFPTVYQRECRYYINDVYQGPLFTQYSDGFINLGIPGEGEEVSFKIVICNKENRFYVSDYPYYFYSFDAERFCEVFNELAEGGLEITEFDHDRIAGTVTTSEDRPVVLTTIPYDKGWKIKADGIPVETYMTLDCLLAFDLPPGEHVLEMVYMPDEYVLGFRLCVIGSSLLLAAVAGEFILLQYRKRKKQKNT